MHAIKKKKINTLNIDEHSAKSAHPPSSDVARRIAPPHEHLSDVVKLLALREGQELGGLRPRRVVHIERELRDA